MKMKGFIGKGILTSFLIVLVFSSAYSQTDHDPNAQPKPCTDVFASVGAIACEENGQCVEVDNAFSCECKPGFIGDGWTIGSGCIEAGNVVPGREKPGNVIPGREKRALSGIWQSAGIKPCRGFLAFMARLVCHRDATCGTGWEDGHWMKCVCNNGLRGNGISRGFPSGSGCY
ncbi:hypothetical protein OS493_006536 [Desmophyllum pertusum]|uniref:EGF-like domain-containing protein n=1 Tax=Desmophyllum pertusum TaxID=174260 RepID=A0A9X0DBH1_9CNID|nr:hypothetical protein OS493_006536 [Desmophyllum pertusum]